MTPRMISRVPPRNVKDGDNISVSSKVSRNNRCLSGSTALRSATTSRQFPQQFFKIIAQFFDQRRFHAHVFAGLQHAGDEATCAEGS